MRTCVNFEKITSRAFATSGQHPRLSLEDNRDKFTVWQNKRKPSPGCSFTDNRAICNRPVFSAGMPAQRMIRFTDEIIYSDFGKDDYDGFLKLLKEKGVVESRLTPKVRKMLKMVLESEYIFYAENGKLGVFVDYLDNLASGTTGIKNNLTENDLMLSFLRTCSITMKKNLKGQEFQAMYHDGVITITCNVNRCIANEAEAMKLSKELFNDENRPRKVKSINFYKPSEYENGGSAHAEIILIRKYLQDLIAKMLLNQPVGDLKVVIAGVRLPCVECAKVLNKLVLMCDKLIHIDYVLPQYMDDLESGKVEEIKGLSDYENQESNPTSYSNTLSYLDTSGINTQTENQLAKLMIKIKTVMEKGDDGQEKQKDNPRTDLKGSALEEEKSFPSRANQPQEKEQKPGVNKAQKPL